MKAFIYNSELHIRTVPAKALFRSSMIHDVVNRGDIFAVRCRDQQLVIVPGTAEVQHVDAKLQEQETTAAPKLAQEGLPLLEIGSHFRPANWYSKGYYAVREFDPLFGIYSCDYYDGSNERRNKRLVNFRIQELSNGYVVLN